MKHGDHAETISTFELLTEHFATEQATIDRTANRRWHNGHDCPHCGVANEITPWKSRADHWRCRACRKMHSVRTGTVFERSRFPLRKWVYAMYLQQTARKGISSNQLSRQSSVTQKTSWFMLQRIREMAGTEFEAVGKILGNVEIDEICIGGLEKNRHADKKIGVGGGAGSKQAVPGFKERETGKTILLPIADSTKKTLHPIIERLVGPEATIFTDGHKGYSGFGKKFEHFPVNHSIKKFVRVISRRERDGNNKLKVHTNSIESVFAVLKRGFIGVYHNWSKKHGWRYLNEFAFRPNEGNVKVDTIDRLNALVDGAIGKRLTYAGLIGEGRGRKKAA